SPLASQFLRVKINGDFALFQGLCKAVLALEAASPGSVLDRGFIERETSGFKDFAERTAAVEWAEIELRSAVTRAEIEKVARSIVRGEKKLITCWAMGLTQHLNAVATIREI